MSDIPPSRYVAFMHEAGNFGVGGFGEISDEFIREAVGLLRGREGNRFDLPNGDDYPDEVQTGMGRTGTTLWASQRIYGGIGMPNYRGENMPPAAISAAKGLGSNHRAALTFVRKDVAKTVDGLTYHTFGENVEDLAVMGTVIQMAQRDDWVGNARERGEQLRADLESARSQTRIPFEIQGRGLMLGIRLESAAKVNAVLRQAPLDGWVCGKGGLTGNVLRVAPPINIIEAEASELAAGIAKTLSSEEVEAA